MSIYIHKLALYKYTIYICHCQYGNATIYSMKSFYHLHVSRTNGRFFHRYILKDIIQASKSEDTKFLNPECTTENWTHHGWNNLISDDTYIICALRDPVETIVSYNLAFSAIVDKEDFFNRIDLVTNIQSRSFIEWKNNKVDPHEDVELDRDLILSRLKRVDMLIDSKDININTYNKIKRKITDDLGFENIEYFDGLEDTSSFRLWETKEFYDSLTEEEINKIKEVNYMDVELYEAAKSLFFPI